MFIERKNARRRDAVGVELKALSRLPPHRTTDFSTATVSVTSSGTISVRNVLYTVPSRLVGCRLKVQIGACPRAGRPDPGDDRLIGYLGTTPVLSVARHYYKRNGPRQRVVDYHHLVGALVKKPQAFRRSVFRDELFPRPVFRRAWEVLDERVEARKACRVYVGLLHLAACMAVRRRSPIILPPYSTPAARPISKRRGRRSCRRPRLPIPAVTVPTPDLAGYDALLRVPVLREAE